MAKRHHIGIDFISRIRRSQELIMAHSGIDEFYEIIRLILSKYLAELNGNTALPEIDQCNTSLKKYAKNLDFILDGNLTIQTPPDIFSEIQKIFETVSISKQDFHALDQAFELLTSRSYKADKGQYFTPRHVIDMCVEALDPKPNELICDPASGSAAFLKSAYTYQKKTYGKTGDSYGFDFSHRACQVARLVSFIGAESKIKIEQLDSLHLPNPKLANDIPTIEHAMGKKFTGFDVIITNPPFAGDISSEAYCADYDIIKSCSRRIERDVLFIERCIRLLKPNGRMAIVLPDNKVSSKNFRDVRLWLGKNSEIRGVVSLHRYTFLPYTSQKAAVVFLVKRPSALSPYDSQVHFFRSDLPGKTSNGSPVIRDGGDPDDPPYLSLDHDLTEIAKNLRPALCATS